MSAAGPGATPPETRDMHWLGVAVLVGCLIWSFVMLVTEQTTVAIYFALIVVALAVLRGNSRK